jgi:cAMP-specific phosphodiesterase 4
VEKGYKNTNFYHHSLHAADVTNSVYFLLQSGLQLCGNITDLDFFALLIAAMCHDIGHPGVNNTFLVLSGDKLAL